MNVSVCPGYVLCHCSLDSIHILDSDPNNNVIFDVSKEQYGINPKRQDSSSFFSFYLQLFNDPLYPKHPDYNMDLSLHMSTPVFCLKMKYIQEFLFFLQKGPLAEGIELLKSLHPPELSAPPIPSFEEDEILSSYHENMKAMSTHIVENVKSIVNVYVKNPFKNLQPTIQEEESQCPFEIPRIDIQLNDIVIYMQKPKDVYNYIRFDFGTLTVNNYEPYLTDPHTHYSYNYLQVKMNGYKLITCQTIRQQSYQQSILSGVMMNIPILISKSFKADVYINDMIITMNEKQLEFVIQTINENMNEKPVYFVEETKPIHVPTVSVAKESAPQPSSKNRLSSLLYQWSDMEIDFKFCLESISIELLKGNDGYDASMKNTDILQSIGRCPVYCIHVFIIDRIHHYISN